ncbi:uncharacterized protein LOC111026817 [Myzus persicae]|uniref:uncharacterized protein LOC111026817 n=1 Tax=Myzus persicae TaxID=13164 RepID=UPI000B932E26|nr:uncharacterized protein LOC111026817 [Myzus persicae]
MCVSGSARTIVKSIPLSEANYDIAWGAMIERYDNQRLLATAHLDKLFAFRPITTESLPSLLTFVNVFQENIAAIKALGVTDLAGFILFFIGSRVLDPATRRLFVNSVTHDSIPTFDLLIKFVQQRCKILEYTQGLFKVDTRTNKTKPTSCARSLLSTGTTSSSPSVKSSHNVGSASSEGTKYCSCCQGDHAIYRCNTFKKWSAVKRRDYALKNRLCFSCLSASHMVNACSSKYNCKACGQRYNTLLHLNKGEGTTSPSTSNQVTTADPSDGTEKRTHFAGAARADNTVLLGTAIVRVRNKAGSYDNVRILVDSGSQISAITTECVTRLGLARRKCRTEIVGLGQSPVKQVRGSVTCSFLPHHASSPIFNCPELIVLNQITSDLPSAPLPSSVRTCYQHLALADPQFDHPSKIVMLIGGDLFPHLIHTEGEIKHTPGFPSAIDTHLGWILIGTVSAQDRQSSPLTSLTASSNPSIDTLMRRFWSFEEPVSPISPTTEDECCERWFLQTTSRKSDGRFCVALPFRDSFRAENNVPSHGLGDTRSLALKRLYNLEQRLGKDTKLYNAYRSFMDDYLSLGYMRLASRPGKYFIPHHAVLKRDGDVSKLRVVFDASAKSSSGLFLNDTLCVGPKLQSDIGELLLQCRLYKFIFIADIVKMYRQIEVRDEDCVYHHILWRSSPDHDVQEYELLTVTYGLSSAPFLAIRVLHALDQCSEPQFPAAKGILTHNTYVDDIVVGRNTEDELLHVQNHIIGLLQSAGCRLKKWCSNSASVLRCVSLE